MEFLFLGVLGLGAFAMGWTAARTIYGDPRKRVVEDDTITTDDDFTRSVQDWGNRYER